MERFRQLLGVDPGKLKAFKNFNQKAIQPAVAEVNFLSDFGCSVEPVTAGRKVVKIRLTWWKKNLEEIKAAYSELQAAKVGRCARLNGTVETISLDTPALPPHPRRQIHLAFTAILSQATEIPAERHLPFRDKRGPKAPLPAFNGL